MKGIIFNLLEESVSHEFGAATWDRLLDMAQLDGAFTSLGNYPDEKLFKLVTAAATALDRPPAAILRWFGNRAIPLLALKYPAFFSKHTSTRAFLLTLNGIIHPEVRKLYPGAETPDFDFDLSSTETLVMGYRSKRKLCALAEGMIEAAAGHFGETVAIQHPLCLHRGDSSCRLEITFAKAQTGP